MKRLYPGGKTKVFTVSYDDGVLQDVPFVELLNKYGIKGTFNLNSRLMRDGFEWTHESGMVVKRLSPSAALHLYDGHEIASHTLTHPYLDHADRSTILREMGEDRDDLKRLFGREVRGFAAPFTFWSPEMAQCAKLCGFEYARISEESRSYAPPRDRYNWRAGIFHLSSDLDSFVDGFLETNLELAMCQIVGHTYDLDEANMWERMENILRRVTSCPDVAFMTTIDIVRFLMPPDKSESPSALSQ